jgi:DNA-binding XRE family transcriptional regulator/quercetin dioxygenase-like cupin family protein
MRYAMTDTSATTDVPPDGDCAAPPEEEAAPPARGPSAADLATDIGRRVAAYRAERGMRVADLAREVGVTPSLISQIEHGQSRPSVTTLFALAQALSLPVDAFFREPGDAGPGTSGPGGPTTPAAATALAAGRRGGPGLAPDDGPATAGGRYVVRRGGRAVIDIEGGVRWERLTRTTLDHLDFFELIYEPGAESHPRQYTHPGTEMVLVMTGCLEITVGFETYRLEPGDSIDFPSSMPHRYLNPGDQTARAVTVILYDCPDPARRAPSDSPAP